MRAGISSLIVLTFVNVILENAALPAVQNKVNKYNPDGKNKNQVNSILEQKDVLLDLVESKLKDLRLNKKKKKADASYDHVQSQSTKCAILPKNADLRLKANGISAVGDTDLSLRLGNSGKSTVLLNSTGISNVGKALVEIVIEEGSLNLPGLNDLFTGECFGKQKCTNAAPTSDIKECLDKKCIEEPNGNFRRTLSPAGNETEVTVNDINVNSVSNVSSENDKALNRTSLNEIEDENKTKAAVVEKTEVAASKTDKRNANKTLPEGTNATPHSNTNSVSKVAEVNDLTVSPLKGT